MMARKTIVFLVGYLFIGVGGLDNSELYWENGFESSSWSLLLENTSVKEYIANSHPLGQNERTDFHFLKKFSTVPRALLLKLLPGVDVLLLHLLVLHDLVLPAVVGHQLHLGWPWLWFGLSLLDATHSWSLTAPLCDLIWTSPPQPALWTAFDKPWGSWFQNSQRTSFRLTCPHASSSSACRRLTPI